MQKPNYDYKKCQLELKLIYIEYQEKLFDVLTAIEELNPRFITMYVDNLDFSLQNSTEFSLSEKEPVRKLESEYLFARLDCQKKYNQLATK
jgi:hypothetical protein